MTLEFLVPQPHQEDTMYRHPSPSQSYSTYSFNQTPTTTQYQIDFPAGNSFQTTGTITESQQGQPPTTNPWATAGFPMSGVPSDWATSSGGTGVVDPYQGSAAFPGSQAAVGPTGSQYSEDIDFYQGFAQTTPGVGSVNTALHRPTMRSPYHHDWMRSTSYRINPQTGKTRTKDKYRVVYSDHQRLELEKEFHYSRYITIRRKAELAVSLGLSERQVKIWFQNRRAKERKHNKKRVALEGATDQKELETSSDEKIDGRLVEIKEEKGLDRVELLDPLCRGEMTPSVESTTPEVLEIGARSQPDFSVHPPLHGTGACQLQPAHVAVSASLFHSMQPLHMK